MKAAVLALQKLLKFRTCTLDISEKDDRWRYFRPCLLHSIRQCTAPCNFRVSKEDYRRQIKKLILVLEGKSAKLVRRMEREMTEAAMAMQFEKAARIRDEIQAVQKARTPRREGQGAEFAAGAVPHRPEEGAARPPESPRAGQDATDH